ncbi:MAG: glycosyltransferase [Candidatus Thermoplasmatota archaeon]|nr:glycosyltransferase [Candidatus Thermoplasmatota archaeon]
MKILVLVSTLDLKFRLGCTPFWWQLLKALYEKDNELIVVPYLGRGIESLWWKTYENPCLAKSILMYRFTNTFQKRVNGGKLSSGEFFKKLSRLAIVPKWKKKIETINRKEKAFDACVIMNVPLNQFEEVAKYIKDLTNIPIIYYDGDMPTILPKYALERGFRFNYYEKADISIYDAFLVNSEGVIPDLKNMGAKNVHPFHYAADPDLIYPTNVRKDRDVAFFGFGSQYREEWMKRMITEPSEKLQDTKFIVGGGNFDIDLGNAEMVGDVPISEYKYFVGRAKLNLNITRKSHASIYKTSTGRIFELPAMGAVMVSQPYNGLEEFFEAGKEYIQLKENDDAAEIYKDLLTDDECREEISTKARQKILKSHTYSKRAESLVEIILKTT